MELEDLKQNWKQLQNKQTLKNTEIMELIQQKSYGPIAALKTAFRKQMVLIIAIAVVIGATNRADITDVTHNILYWCYLLFCIGIAIFFYFNYKLVSNMEIMDNMVKTNLEKQIEILETRLKYHLVAIRIIGVFFIVLCEVLPYFQHHRMLHKWHALSPAIRFAAYGAFIVFQYFVSKRVAKKKFGQHLTYLKKLVHQL